MTKSETLVGISADGVSVGTFARPFGSTCASVTTVVVVEGCMFGTGVEVAFVYVITSVVI